VKDAVAVAAFLILGAFSLLGGLMNWDFFMKNYRARPLVSLFGRGWARIFYILLGLSLILISIFGMISVG
jgi:hypothetical protein